MQVSWLVVFLLVMMVVQGIGTYLQVRQYKEAVRRLRKFGNLGIGSRRGKLRPGNIVVIACDGKGMITAGEMLEGFTIFNRFQSLAGITGKTIYELKAEYEALSEKKRKRYKGHIQAVEALYIRLHPRPEILPIDNGSGVSKAS